MVCAARTLNPVGQAQVTLSPRYEQLRAVRGPRQEKGAEIRPKRFTQAGFAYLKKINVHVYERARGRGTRGYGGYEGGGFQRISCFTCPGVPASRSVHVVYCGNCHYNALEIT